MNLVKWVDPRAMMNTFVEGRLLPSGNDAVPVIPLSALREVVEGLKLSLDYYRSIGTRKFNPYEVEQTLEKLLAQLEAHRKEGV